MIVPSASRRGVTDEAEGKACLAEHYRKVGRPLY